MKEKLFKKGLKRRLFSVVLALAMMLGLMPGMELTVLAGPLHSWSYVANGATLTATCSDASCTLPGKKVSLTLTASSTNYSGSAVSVRFGKGEVDAWKAATGEDAPTIVYEAKTGSTLTDGKAVNIGSYTAKITVGGKTASIDFEIDKAICPIEPSYLKKKVVSPSKAGASDGKITNVTSKMEYSLDNGSTWKAITGTEITGLKAGEVLVRYKETATVKAGYIVKVTVPDGKNDTPDGDDGNVKVPEDKQNGNFEAGGIKNSVAEVKAAVLTAEDKAAIAAGKDVSVWVEVKDQTATVAKADKTKVEEKLDKNFVVGTYLDITLWKQLTDSDASRVTNVPNGKVKIGFTIPENLQKAGRTYKIVRVHNGVVEIIDATVDKNYGLTFETDKFSTYALVYFDKPAEIPTEKPAEIPETGDTTPIALYVTLLTLAGTSVLATRKRKTVR